MILMGNILLLAGIPIILGARKTLTFFARKEKFKGTACVAVGITFIIARWPMIGFFIEVVGLFFLFADFISVLVG